VNGRRVAELRKAQGKTQAELARAADIGEMHLSAIERGAVGDVKLSTAQALATALGVSIADLLGEQPSGTVVR
jgi:transcriptional regulator with XRE-family HTH domain